jgi:ADP-ribose pyrophosphatase
MASNRRPVLKLGVVDLGIETSTLPNGLTVDLAVIRHPGASAVVALDDEGRVILLSQWRYAMGGYIWEVPAGCRNGTESPSECARRELREETGYVAAHWERLGEIVTIPSFCDERIEIFLARELSRVESQMDPDEVIRVEKISLPAAFSMIADGRIIDAKTIIALQHARSLLS